MYRLSNGKVVDGTDWAEVESVVIVPEVIGTDNEGKEFVAEEATTRTDIIQVQPLYLTPEERKAFRIEEIPSPPPPANGKFFWVSEEVTTPKAIEQIRPMLLEEVRIQASQLLAPTDWAVLKALETDAPQDPKLKAYRAAVRAYSNELNEQINALRTAEEAEQWELKGFKWPVLEEAK